MADTLQMPDTGWEIHTRREERYRIPGNVRVWVDFDDPNGERKRWRVQLVDLSPGGLSFVRCGGRPPVDQGIRLERAVIHGSGWKIHGSLIVAHVTPHDGSSGVGGASFLPASAAEAVKLRTLIAGMLREQDPEVQGD